MVTYTESVLPLPTIPCEDTVATPHTSFETALKIIFSDCFRFSPLSKMNDTTEQKLRLKYNFQIETRKQSIERFEKYWSQWSSNTKLLCFSRDLPKEKACGESKDIFDVGGRGFALPRMWAQYASNNSGICLIIRKKELESLVKAAYPYAICDNVSYYEWFSGFEISETLFNQIDTCIKHDSSSSFVADMLCENKEFTKYSYFCKLKDWENENEYRILIPSKEREYLYIENISSCLAGMVIGEKVDSSLIKPIIMISEELDIPIRKISFGLRRCLLENVTEV